MNRRHRPPRPPATGPLDAEQRHTARRIALHYPRWAVMWGLYSRRYYAFPLFDTPGPTVISAPGPQALIDGMREAEHVGATPAARGRGLVLTHG